ncbi:hypothetical protein AB2B38_010445 [Balneola sp. MJW-20]|uniref:hypothetical protein n=1 Tax=Gracilimonas aurantiaca TaxID=3234185 RepID=UPI0034679E81
MSFKEKSREEIVKKIDEFEKLIESKGLGAQKLQKAKRVQRDLNLGLMVGTAALLGGLTAWVLFRDRD